MIAGLVRKPAHLPGDHHLARRAERRKGVPARHHRPRGDLCGSRCREGHGEPGWPGAAWRAGRPRRDAGAAAPGAVLAGPRWSLRPRRRRRPRPRSVRAAGYRPPTPQGFRQHGGAGNGAGAEGEEGARVGEDDLDDDDMENSLSLAAIEAELKPKVLETFDKIAERIQAAAPPAGPGHRQPAGERVALARAGAQVQEDQGRPDHRGEVAAAQPGAHRRAGRAALRHQQAARLVRRPPDAARRKLWRRRARTSSRTTRAKS